MSTIYVFFIATGICSVNLYTAYKVDSGSNIKYKIFHSLICVFLIAMSSAAPGNLVSAILHYDNLLSL